MTNTQEITERNFKKSFSDWYDKYYKLLLVIPIILFLLSLFYLGYMYQKTGNFVEKDISLTGGTSITIQGDTSESFESQLKGSFPDISVRKLTDLRTGETTSFIVETSTTPEEIKPEIERILSYKLDEKNSNIEFTGSSLSLSFYKQLITALIISFILE